MTKMLYTSVLIFACAHASLAQMQGADGQINLTTLSEGGKFRSFDSRFKGIEGSPTLFEDFRPGRMKLKGSDTYVVNKKMNYDAHEDDLLVIYKNAEVVVTKTMLEEFEISSEDDTLYFKKVDENGSLSFMQELSKGRVTLYKKNKKVISQPNNTGAYSTGKTYSTFEFVPEYYWSADNKKVELIKNKKSLLMAFDPISDELKQYIKSNELDFKKDEDMITLFEYINSIK